VKAGSGPWGPDYQNWPFHKLSGSASKALHILITHSNRYGTCFPSRTTIAARAGIHKSTVTAALAELEALGILNVARTNGSANRYRLVPPTGRPQTTASNEGRSRSADSGSRPQTTRAVAPARPITEPLTNLITDAEKSADAERGRAAREKARLLLGGGATNPKISTLPEHDRQRRSPRVALSRSSAGLAPLSAAIAESKFSKRPP